MTTWVLAGAADTEADISCWVAETAPPSHGLGATRL